MMTALSQVSRASRTMCCPMACCNASMGHLWTLSRMTLARRLFPLLPLGLRYNSPHYAIYAVQEGHGPGRFDSQRARFVPGVARVGVADGVRARRAAFLSL